MRIRSVLGLVLASIAVLPLAPQPRPRTYVVKATPPNVEWGYFDPFRKPILTIRSGDIVEVETPLAGSREMEDLGMPGSLIRPSMRELEAQVKDRSATYGNMLVGPIAVEDAEPGDVLEVRILDVRPADNYALNVFHPGGGTLPAEFPYAAARAIPLDLRRNVALFAPGIEIPLAPFFGTMGVAPSTMVGRISDRAPGYYAGNLDNKHLVAGSTLYIPVQCAGALFSVGDGHVGQGDGEVDGTAIEAALRGTFEFRLRKKGNLRWPRAETPDAYMTMGFDPDLNAAAQMAVHEMVGYLVSERGLSRGDAYMLCSMAVDLQVTEVVDGTKVVQAVLPKRIFQRW
ncbi:MAG TPA: acetamidase/formamidase family protein [Candidatus Acidoferrales bacterium]|nr:acetamidase/formamidase family protein [Candidatus Acidoferrales bacterium]